MTKKSVMYKGDNKYHAFQFFEFRVSYTFSYFWSIAMAFPQQCNIDKNDRVNRTVIGIVLCLFVLLGLPRFFFLLTGVILIIEGAIGWCGIPILVEKWKESQKKGPQ